MPKIPKRSVKLPITEYHDVDIPEQTQREIAIRLIEIATGLPHDAFASKPNNYTDERKYGKSSKLIYTTERDRGDVDYVVQRKATESDLNALKIISQIQALTIDSKS